MSRTGRRKIVYFSIVIGGAILGFWAIQHFALNVWQILLLVLLFLLPGRVLGFFWQDLLRGLRLLKEKRYEESARCSQAFLEQVRARPWLRHLIWLGSGTYSRDPEALALNNLGAAELMLGKMDKARGHLDASLQIDDENPLPYVNLARWAQKTDRTSEVAGYLEAARKRGFNFGLADKVVMSSQDRFTRTDGGSPRP